METPDTRRVVIIGGGPAGLSAAIYLRRALREVLVIDDGRSLAAWEPDVQNYLGFSEGISGEELLRRGRAQAERYGAVFIQDTITRAESRAGGFYLQSSSREFTCDKLLIATGLYHLPPEISGIDECFGHSIFFCKDCDAFRVQGKRIAIIGSNNEAVEYALGMLVYSACVIVVTNGKGISWDEAHARALQEYNVPVFLAPVHELAQKEGQVDSILFSDDTRVALDAVFTTRGDIYHNQIGLSLGAKIDPEGQILVDHCLRTTVPGLYAAGCVTPANCQIIVAAGQGAAAAQSINRDLFEEDLANHTLRHFREQQIQEARTLPEVLN